MRYLLLTLCLVLSVSISRIETFKFTELRSFRLIRPMAKNDMDQAKKDKETAELKFLTFRQELERDRKQEIQRKRDELVAKIYKLYLEPRVSGSVLKDIYGRV